jgi:fucose 4-O-acetylase-like acetyltransferase
MAGGAVAHAPGCHPCPPVMNRQYGALSGVAILLIVINHAIHFGLQVAPVQSPWFQVLVTLQALGAFAVPVFLFVSGAFLAYAAREFTATFIRSSLERILWPYIIWSGIFYALVYFAKGENYSIAGYVKNLAVGYPYHFVPLLVFWYLASPAVVWAGRRRGALLLTLIGAWQAWLLVLRFPAMFGMEGQLPGWAAATIPPIIFTSMADWGIFFPLGLVMSLHGKALRPQLARWRPASLAVVLAIFALGLLNAFRWVDAPWARLLAPVPLMFILPTIDRGSIPFLDLFERLGRRSYGIYLTHFVIVNGLTLAVERGIVPLRGQPLIVLPFFLAMALGGALLLMDTVARTPSGRLVYRFVFGIVPPALAPPRAAGEAAVHVRGA